MINTLYRLAQDYADYPLCSVMMFTDTHTHVIQMLEDVRYYRALDEMTGKDIALFHTRLFQGRYERPDQPPGLHCLMIPVWKEPQANRQLLALFDMKDSTHLPCLVTFVFADGDIHYTLSKINNESPVSAFNSVGEIVRRLVKAAGKSSDKLATLSAASFEMRVLNIKKGMGEFLGKLGAFRGAAGI